MNIACAYDANVLELVAGARLYDPLPERRFSGRRYPYVLHLRQRDTGWEFTVVGVHLKSGGLGHDPPNDEKRRKEIEHLAGWLVGVPDRDDGHFQQPPTADILVIGDFNALRDHSSLTKLRTGTLGAWQRPLPQVMTSLAGEGPSPWGILRSAGRPTSIGRSSTM